MRIKKVCKLCIDIGMLVITLLLMASERTGIVLHMFLGAALFILFVAHNILNLAWWAGIGKGLYSRTRWMRTILNVLLLIDFLLVMVSGILYAVGLHRITVLLFLILTVIHIRVHWKRASAKQQK
ncbi:hypothetical protein D7V94_11145 [Parablautia intestinalis]|uniref:DUF4405 domain-containing protein n=1 Tax=Parablautia intestinalis TaxID=2320100 RepID=A0A3A9AXH0_9FIRM|nr:hypothetical protein [Parablautia intestinalis]RKI91065.1 hypothetical protein D7V94_11145 [Parablautia intestinalis]